MPNFLAFVTAAVLTLGSASSAQEPNADLEALTRSYEQAFNKGDAKALAALYAKDAIDVGPEGTLLIGQASIEQGFIRAFGGPAKGVRLALKAGRTLEVTSDVRIVEGTYHTTGGTTVGSGRYVNTLVRQGGRWRLASVVVVPESGAMDKPRHGPAKRQPER